MTDVRSKPEDLLLLLNSSSTSRHQTVYGGFCLGEDVPRTEAEDRWPLWANCGNGDLPCRLAQHQVSIVHYSGSGGSGWVKDGIDCQKLSMVENLRLFAESRRNALKLTPPYSLSLPAFVSGTAGLKPAVCDVTVELSVRRMIDLPDVQTRLEFGSRLWKRRNPYTSAIKAEAENECLFDGLSLPVQMESRGHWGKALLRLYAGVNGTYSGRVYLPRIDCVPEPGMTLCRTSGHIAQEKYESVRAEVARVISVDVVQRMRSEYPGDGFVFFDRDGEILPIACLRCNERYEPEQFSQDQLQAIDLWGHLQPQLNLLNSPYTKAAAREAAQEAADGYLHALQGRKVHCLRCRQGIVALKSPRHG